MGCLFIEGLEVEKNTKIAIKWFSQSSAQGFAKAHANLALIYYSGDGVKKDYKKAYNLFKKAAFRGFQPAQCWLGWLFHQGQGIKQDLIKAHCWYSIAIENGCEDAEKDLQKLLSEKEFTENLMAKVEKGKETIRTQIKMLEAE